MKKVMKAILVAVPALVIAATVGLSTMGCDDEGGGEADLAQAADLSTPKPADLATKD